MNWPAFATFVHHHWQMCVFIGWCFKSTNINTK